MEDTHFLQRLQCLSEEIESCTDLAVRERMRGVVQIVLDFHQRGLARLMQHLSQSGHHGLVIFDALSSDELVSSLLLLHDLHPLDLNTRLQQVIEKGSTQWATHGVLVQLAGVSPEGIVQLKAVKSSEGWPPSPTGLRTSIQQAIYAAAPDVSGVVIEGLENPPRQQGFVPVSAVRIQRAV